MNSLIQKIPSLKNNPEDVFIIHLSYGSAKNTNHSSPRIVCIYIQNMDSSISEKFSLEKCASKNKIPINEISYFYNDLEETILDEFNTFLKQKPGCTFIYWAEEGQELCIDILKSRFEEINKEETQKNFYTIPSQNRKSIQFLTKGIYNETTSDLKQFIKNNNKNVLIPNFLTSEEEYNRFELNQLNSVSASAIAKVSFFVKLINELSKKEAEQTNKPIAPIDLHSMTPIDIIKNLNTKSIVMLVGLLTSAGGVGYSISLYNSNLKIEKFEKATTQLNDSIVNEHSKYAMLQKKFEDSTTYLNIQLKNNSADIISKTDTIKLTLHNNEKVVTP